MVELAAIRHFALAFEIDRLVVQNRFAAIQMLDELGDAAAVKELLGADVLAALIGQHDLEAFVQECQLPQTLRQKCQN